MNLVEKIFLTLKKNQQTLFDTLGKNKINIQVITTSEIKISILINDEFADLAVQKLHHAYKLYK